MVVRAALRIGALCTMASSGTACADLLGVDFENARAADLPIQDASGDETSCAADCIACDGGTCDDATAMNPTDGGENLPSPPTECIVVARDLESPSGIAVANGYVYWTTEGSNGGPGTLQRAPRSGGDISTLATGRFNRDVIVDEHFVYYTDGAPNSHERSLVRLPLSAGEPQTLAAGLYDPYALKQNAKNLFFTLSQKAIAKIEKSGGAVARLIEVDGSDTLGSFAVNENELFWIRKSSFSPSGLLHRGIAGGQTERLQSAPLFGSLTIDATHIYWTNEESLLRTPLAGGAPVKLSDAKGDMGIAVDDQYVYWSEAWKDVVRVPNSGGNMQIIATGTADVMTIDDRGVYWVEIGINGPGRIRACPK